MKRVSPVLLSCLVFGCGTLQPEIQLTEGDFALLELRLQDCTSNERHLGLEKLLRNLYGTVPQIDLDRQFARVRIPRPVVFDFAAIAEKVERTNTGLGGIAVVVRTMIRGDQVEIVDTGQRFPLEAARPPDEHAEWRRLELLGWKDPSPVRARLLD